MRSQSRERQSVKKPIAAKLLRVVLSLYFVVASLVTVVHLGLEYTKAEHDVVQSLDIINKTFNQAIATSAWNLDERQLHPTLQGILALPVIMGVHFSPNDGNEKISLGQSEVSIAHSYPVIYQPGEGGSPIAVGTLTLFSDRTIVLAKIKHSFYIILLNALIKTLVLYALFMWAGRRLLSQPLAHITERLQRFDGNGDLESMRIDSGRPTDDEFGVLQDAFNKMIERINAASAENRRLNGDLTVLNRELEERVKIRTMQLHETQSKLLKAAHAAGVSQVTSEILHNVGNIVNSIIIAVNDMRDSLAEDEFNKLMKVMAVMEDKIAKKEFDGMAEINEFITLFASKTKKDMDGLREVLEGLQKFVMHLRHITEMQKSNLQDAAYENEIALETTLDDSLYLAGLKNNPQISVLIEKGARHLPPFLSDEHKLIQVLVNLLLNARQAVMEGNRSEKLVKVTLGTTRQHVCITIEDNGVGIAPDNLPRIFQSGFTTKVTGSGLGLHNSANNIKAMGGEIECHSGGEWTGARFTVRLPLKRVKKAV